MIKKEDVVAIVGASSDSEKYGNIVMRDLIGKGYNVVPINPKEEFILDKKVYHSILDVEGGVDAVIFVTKPEVTRHVLEDVLRAGIKRVWMQPGSESEEAIEFCKKNGIECVHNSCIMLQ